MIVKRAVSVIACGLVLGSAVVAQQPDAKDMVVARAAWDALRQGQYLAAALVLRSRAFDGEGRPRPGFAHQQWREAQGLMTGEPPAAATEPASGSTDVAATAALAGARATDAVAAIVERAKSTRIVILNEDHALPRNRAFALEVARALRPLGYDVLAVETLTNEASAEGAAARMTALARDGYPRRTTGTYLRDPVFADFLRQALALGFRPVAYETTDHERKSDPDAAIARREQMQADYIMARALKAYPQSKLLIYVGFSHAAENPQSFDGDKPRYWLASRLKAQTGIDPLTIDQVTLSDAGSGDRRLYASVANRIGRRSAVMMAEGAPLVVGQYAGLIDLQVAHPRTGRVAGRPDWLAAMGRVATPIPAALLPRAGTRLVQAFVASEAADAIPVDQVLVTAAAPVPPLMLPRVAVRFAVQDAPPVPVRTPPAR